MAFNQKIARLGQDIIDALTFMKLVVTTSYDASNDLVLTVADQGFNEADAVIRLLKIPQIGNNLVNPVTGLVEDVFTPHIIQVGFAKEAQASGTATLNAVVATNTLTVNGVVFTAVAGAPAADQFQVGGTDTITAANLAAAINASVSAGVAGIVTATSAAAVVTITATAGGTGGNAITLAGTAVRFTVSGATLTGGVNTATSALTRYKVLAESFTKGTQVDIYEKATAFVVADFAVANLVLAYRNIPWGNIAHI